MNTGPTRFEQAAQAVAAGADPVAEAAGLVSEMTNDEKLWCLDGDLPCWAGLADLAQGGYHRRPFPAARVDRLGIPGFAFSDGPRGVVIGPATCFPVSMARGATWDVGLEERIGEAIGRELRAVGADLYGGVCVNLLRHPAWGRAQETYGEDPFHVGEMGAALTRGVQRHAMATVKHFAANSMENARFTVDVSVDDDALHEVFLPHFRRVIDEGVACVMSAYNSVNGEWCGQHPTLLTDVLRDEWNFDGFVISDWIFGLRDAARSLAAGLDVEMPYRMVRASHLADALANGQARWEDVDRSVTRLVATLLRFHEIIGTPVPAPETLACPEHRALAREAAAKAVVLLRNEPVGRTPVLPVDLSSVRSIAVLGRLAGIRNLGDGGSSDVWAPEAVTVVDGLREAAPGVDVVHDDGSDPAAAAAIAERCDLAIVVVGYTKADEGEFIGAEGTAHLASLFPGPDDPELAAGFQAAASDDPWPDPPDGVGDVGGFAVGGDRRSLRLHDQDESLIHAVATAQPRTVVALVAGSAVVVEAWVDLVPALVQCWYGGMEAGRGLADVVTGTYAPSGRLPFSVPTDPAHLPPFDRDATTVVYDAWHGWWRLERDGHAPRFPFGFGLAYTSFALGEFECERRGDDLVISGTVENAGHRDGVDVVQIYGSIEGRRPRLLGFARVEVLAGQEASVAVEVPLDRLAERVDSDWRLPSGRLDLRVARHAADQRAREFSVDV